MTLIEPRNPLPNSSSRLSPRLLTSNKQHRSQVMAERRHTMEVNKFLPR